MMFCGKGPHVYFTVSLFVLLQGGSFSFSVASNPPQRTSSLEASTTSHILERVQVEHDAEVAEGFSIWGRPSSSSEGTSKWTDDDFAVRSVGVGNAGPQESMLGEHGNKIFETVKPVLSVDECETLIAEARAVIAKGLKEENEEETNNNPRQPTNSQLGEARLSQMPNASQWLRQALHERLFPLLESRFGVPAAELTLNDALIIGYGYFGQMSRSQPIHRDADLLSLNVALSTQDSYDPDGGGTYFEGMPTDSSVIKTDQGHVLCHSGGAPHAGRGIASGERWILVLFCVAANEPQLSRRCHAQGMIAKQEGDLEAAEAAFAAGLSVTPNDHLLLSSMGGICMTRGEEPQARAYLAKAADAYEPCQKANLALGRMFLANRRPRAALRRFEAVLDHLNDCDLQTGALMPLKAMGWDARVYGSHAALVCAQEATQRKGGRISSFDSNLYLGRAVERLNVALSSVPGDERILSMLAHAEDLRCSVENIDS